MDKINSIPIGLYRECATDLKKTLESAQNVHCSILITSIVNPSFHRELQTELANNLNHIRFTRSDLLLEPSQWAAKIVAKLNDAVDCDSNDENYRKYSESVIKQEMNYAQHIGSNGCMMIKIRGSNTDCLAALVASELKNGTLLVELPMVDPNVQWSNYANDASIESQDPWQWWNKFRSTAEFHPRMMVALEMTADLPSTREILRWLGEPVNLLIIPISVFVTNEHNYPVLSVAHKSVALKFLSKMNCKFILKAPNDEHINLDNYVQYLKYLYRENAKIKDLMEGYDDVLEIPLQPLYDNLDTYTYEIFEKDPVKYILYQRAIEEALKDKISDADAETKTAIIMVVGAGRGPLVRSTINASRNAQRKVKIFVIEKNPNAIVTLSALQEEMWQKEDLTIISCDMRDLKLSEKADIIVSELLGSFGDNELSPECLDGAQNHLKSDGISIPCKSTSYLNPVMSPKLLNAVQDLRGYYHRSKTVTVENQAESSYVVYFRNVFHICEPKPVFTFVHPNYSEIIDNSRFTKLEFDIQIDCVLTGFAGYFDTVLYKNIKLSTHPLEHTQGLISWFSMYFPLTNPQYLRAGEKLGVNFWRCTSSTNVWYQWNTMAPTVTHVHNLKGRACSINK